MSSNILNEVPDLQEEYGPTQQLNRITYLRLIRPHRGVWIEPTDMPAGDDTSLPKRLSIASSYDTLAIDILLILLRQLISFGYSLGTHKPETSLEEVFMDVVNKDLGWKPGEDLRLKRHILATMNPSTEKILDLKSLLVQDLLAHPELRNLFDDNGQFRLFDNNILILGEDGSYQHMELPFDRQDVQESNRLHFEAPNLLADDISEALDRTTLLDGRKAQVTSLRPKFLRVECKVSDFVLPMAQRRELRFEAPEARLAEDEIYRGIQSATYRLCAVIKMGTTPGDEERIRTYWPSGREIVPGEIGNYKAKEPEASEPELRRWSVENPGTYMLFYFREHRPDGWPAADVQLDAPESEPRAWVGRSN